MARIHFRHVSLMAHVSRTRRTLLEGSKRAATLKGGEDMPAFSSAPRGLGAAAEAVASAYHATRSEVQSEVLPAKVDPDPDPDPDLDPDPDPDPDLDPRRLLEGFESPVLGFRLNHAHPCLSA